VTAMHVASARASKGDEAKLARDKLQPGNKGGASEAGFQNRAAGRAEGQTATALGSPWWWYLTASNVHDCRRLWTRQPHYGNLSHQLDDSRQPGPL